MKLLAIFLDQQQELQIGIIQKTYENMGKYN